MKNLALFLAYGYSLSVGSAFWGGWIVRFLGLDAKPLPFAIRTGLGLIVLIFLLILLGALHLYTPQAMTVVWLIWLAASLAGYTHLKRESFFTEPLPECDPTWNPLFLRMGLSLILLVCLLNCMTPETRHDPYDYHLTIPDQYLANHAIVEIPWHVFTYMPKNCEILYGMGLGVGDDSLTKLTHYLFGCLCLFLYYSFIRKIAGHEAGLLASFLVGTLPLFGFIDTASYIDLARAFWELSALYLLYRVWEESHQRTQERLFILSALFAGMALGTKYVALLVFLPSYGLLSLWVCWKRLAVPKLWIFILWGIVLIIPLAPWMIFNVVWTANPIYPLMPSIFGMHIPPARDAYQFILRHAPLPDNLQWMNVLGYFCKRIYNLVLEGNALVLIGTLSWLLAPWWKRHSLASAMSPAVLRGILFYMLLSSLSFLIGSENMDGRFFFSTLSMFAIPSVFFMFALSHHIKQTSLWGRYVIPGFVLILLANAVTYRFNQIRDLDESPVPILTESQRDLWLSRRFAYYDAVRWVENNLPANAYLLGMGYPLRLRHIARVKYGYIPFLTDLNQNTSVDDLADRLLQNGITHVVEPFPDLPNAIDLSILKPTRLLPVFVHRGVVIYELLP